MDQVRKKSHACCRGSNTKPSRASAATSDDPVGELLLMLAPVFTLHLPYFGCLRGSATECPITECYVFLHHAEPSALILVEVLSCMTILIKSFPPVHRRDGYDGAFSNILGLLEVDRTRMAISY